MPAPAVVLSHSVAWVTPPEVWAHPTASELADMHTSPAIPPITPPYGMTPARHTHSLLIHGLNIVWISCANPRPAQSGLVSAQSEVFCRVMLGTVNNKKAMTED